MKVIWTSAVSLVLLVQAASAQSLGDFARKERERKKAQEQKATIQVSTDEVRGGKLDLSPQLDPARKGDLSYLLQQLSHPKVSAELLEAFVPLKDLALPKLLPLLGSTEPFRRAAPATVLMVLGNSEGLASMARLLEEATEPPPTPSAPVAVPSSDQNSAKGTDAASTATAPDQKPQAPASTSASPEEALRKKLDQNRLFGYALEGSKFGVWRFTEGSMMTPDQVTQRLKTGPPIGIVGGPDNGQRIFNRALRDQDPNLRRGAIALVRVASGGSDYGFQPDQAADQNESAIQQITSFLTTQRGKVISQLGAKTP